jgi:hypothetical protein
MYYLVIKIAVNEWVNPSVISERFAKFDEGVLSLKEVSFNNGELKTFLNQI